MITVRFNSRGILGCGWALCLEEERVRQRASQYELTALTCRPGPCKLLFAVVGPTGLVVGGEIVEENGFFCLSPQKGIVGIRVEGLTESVKFRGQTQSSGLEKLKNQGTHSVKRRSELVI